MRIRRIAGRNLVEGDQREATRPLRLEILAIDSERADLAMRVVREVKVSELCNIPGTEYNDGVGFIPASSLSQPDKYRELV